ncbi:hypothetical protein ES703_67684 [subsurface metagenome]
MQFRTETFRPAKLHIRFYLLGGISRVWVVGSLRWNHKAPDIAFPRTIRLGVIDLINSPVICCARDETIRISKSGEAGNKKRCGLVALERALGASVHIVGIFA